MIAGLLNTQLTLRPLVSTGEAERWVDGQTIRAERVRTSSRMRVEQGEAFADYTVRFRIRLGHEVREGWQAQERGGYLYVIDNIEPDRRNGMLTLVCSRFND